MNDDYKLALMGQDEMINNYTVTGTNTGITSARVSYHYNLLGPSIVLDTACSSALVAIHLAASAMKSGEMSMAICGGVSCMINPENFISLSKAKMASPTGKCHAFSKHADGYARGEGCGIVILKKLYKAQEDNNKIWGIIVTGCNQDGRTTSPITAPSSSQQIKLLEKVFGENDVCPSTIQYIEAHGTGTSVGDPIEANALGTFFSKNQKSKEKNIFIGSVKTNIGHLESAAGVAGLIKILLMMNHGVIVPSLHSDALNPKIDFERYNLAVPQVTTKWLPTTTGERIACMNSFGFGGTNSHAIVKETIHSNSTQMKSNEGTLQIIVLSANDAVSLRKTAERYIQNVRTSNFSIESLAYTSTVRRDHYRLRTFVIAESKTSLPNLFHSNFNDVKVIRPVPLQAQSVVFVFCGVGTAWQGMCKELLQRFLVFRNAVREIDSVLLPLTKWSIFEILSKGKSVIENPMINHIAIFTCQIALVHLWRSFGITPMSVIGQSVGEVAAAYTSGALDLEQAITVIYHRSRVLAEATGGAMAVVQGVKLEEIELECKTLKSGKAGIAVYISNDCCTVSGDTSALDELKQSLKSKQHIRWVDLNVPCAYHSHLTKGPGMKLAEEIKSLKPKANTIQVFSSVTGESITNNQYCNPSYWAANVTEKVKFFQAVTESGKLNNNTIYLEIGPSPVLRPHVRKIYPNDIVEVVPSMTKNKDIRQFLWALGKLYVLGLNLDWRNLFEGTPHLADIPNYCFNCKSLYEESVIRAVKRAANIDSSKHYLLTEKGSGDKFTVILSEQRTPYVFDHRVEESIIVPGALYGTIGIELGKAVLGLHDNLEVGWEIENPLAVNANHSTELTIESDKNGDSMTYRIFDVKRRMLSKGSLKKYTSTNRHGQFDIRMHKERLNRKPYDDFIYNTLQRFGIHHGPVYKIVRKGIYTKRECFAEVNLTENHLAMFEGADIHPIVIDSILQCCCAFLPFFDIPLDAKLFPVGIGKLCTKQKVTTKMYIYAKNVGRDSYTFYSNAILLQENGIVVAEMLNIETRIMNMPLNGNELSLHYNWHKMIVEENKKSDIAQQMVVVSRSRHTLDFIQGETIYDNVYIDESLEFDVAKEAILSKNPDLLAYVPGHINGQNSIQEIYDEILNDGKTFLKLIKSYSHLELKVVTVTEATQNLNTENQMVNVLGAELWGMVRSIAREPTKLSFYLIDTYPDLQQNLKALNTMLCRICENDEEIPFESCIINGEIHYGSIQQMYANDTLRKPAEHVRERKGIPLHQNGTYASENGLEAMIEVSVVVACQKMFDTSGAENITQPPKIGNIWTKENRHQVETKCVEFIGSSYDREKKRDVICCFPCSLQSKISVPKHLTCPKDDIPNYSLGMFQSCIWAMTIAENVRNIKKVIIMADEDFHGALWILEQILNKKDITTDNISDVDYFDPRECDKACLLMLPSTEKLKLDSVRVDIFSTVIYSDSKYNTFFEDTSIMEKIFLPPNEIFSLQNISKKIKDAKRFLKKMSRKKIPKKVKDNTYGEVYIENKDSKCGTNHDSIIVKENSSYIVVGGLTGLGWLIVKHLVRCSAKKVIIFSRRIPDEKMQRKIQGINDLSETLIIPIQVDICNLHSLSKVFLDLKSLCHNEPIRGIFHGAAVTDDKFASEMSLDQYEVPLRPKVLGTLNLDHVSLDLELDYFVTHSSIAALLGNVGQCNYAAGNSFQDCFALYRRSRGMPATSIIWSALDIGLAADIFTKESLKSSGLISLSQEQILDCTNIAVRSGEVYRIFAHIDWKVFLQTFINSQKSKFKDFWSDSPLALSVTLTKSGNVEPIDENGMIEMVLDCVANVFALHPSQISVTTPIVEFGLDSQKGTELASLIFDRSSIRVPYIFIATDDHSAFDIAQFVKSRQEMGILSEIQNGNRIKKKTLNCFLEEVLLTESNVVYNEVHLVVTDATIDECTIQTSLQVLLYSHPQLRTMLHIEIDSAGKETLRKEIREIEDAVLQIEICDNKSPDDAINVRHVKCEAFKINIIRRSRDIAVTLMFCPLMFDAYCIVRITDEASKLINYSRTIPSIYSTMSEYQDQSQQPKFEEFLALEEEKMKIFWGSELSRHTGPIFTETKKSTEEYQWTSLKIPDHVVSLLHEIGSRNYISIYQTMCCFAQIALGIVTKASEVTILAQTDMRSLIGLEEIEVGMYSNLIPLITDLSEQRNCSLQDFMFSTVRKFESMEEEGKYPFHLIKDLPEFEESKHQILVCFFVDENNLNEYRKTVKVQGYRPGFTSLARVELMIVSSSEHIKLYLSSEESLHAKGVALLKCIYHLSELYIGNGDIKVEELLTPKAKMGDLDNTNGTLFMKKKRTSSCAVEPKLRSYKGNCKHLQIGHINLQLCDIVSVSVSDEDRQRLVIQTKKKNIILYANDVTTCEVWATYINSKLNRQMKGWKWKGSQSCLLQPISDEVDRDESTYL